MLNFANYPEIGMLKRIFVVLSLVWCVVAMAAAKQYVLVIDAGHGGKDAGACYGGAKEKDINLSVALAFGRCVEQNCKDVKVIYTRTKDVFVPLHERAAIANRNKADVFISIHTNSMPGKQPKAVSGIETYTMGMRRSDEKLSAAQRENEVISYESDYKQRYAGYDPKSPESMLIFEVINEQNMAASVELATLIQKKTCALTGRRNGGVRQDVFLVLRETSMPACLVELGYITTTSDRSFLTGKSNVSLLGQGLYQAFVAFKNKQQGKAVSTPAKVAAAPAQEPAPEVKKKEEKPDTLPKESKPESARSTTPVGDAPVFKVQVLTGDRKLSANSSQFKGLKGVDSYKDGNMWKYTVGNSTNYNEIYALLKQVRQKFPGAFIIAFKAGERMDVNEAIREFKKNKK